jgi:hypothetical protein
MAVVRQQKVPDFVRDGHPEHGPDITRALVRREGDATEIDIGATGSPSGLTLDGRVQALGRDFLLATRGGTDHNGQERHVIKAGAGIDRSISQVARTPAAA